MSTPVDVAHRRRFKWYLAGPMTGIPQFNIPAFEKAAKELRDRGARIISPVELDSEAIREASMASPDGALPEDGKIGGESWGEILGRDVRVVADEADGVVMLHGWWKSKGARLEAFTAIQCGKTVAVYDRTDWLGIVPLSYSAALEIMSQYILKGRLYG